MPGVNNNNQYMMQKVPTESLFSRSLNKDIENLETFLEQILAKFMFAPVFLDDSGAIFVPNTECGFLIPSLKTTNWNLWHNI